MTVTSLAPRLLEPAELRRAFGHFPSGVVAVCAEVEGRPAGIAASSFTSVSLDPPLVSVAVAKSSSTWPRLREAGEIGLSVLAEEHAPLCRQLAGPVEQRFAGLRSVVSSGGAVVFRDAVATYTTVLHQEVDAGDHVIVLLRVLAVEAGEAEQPLVFHRSTFARLAVTDPARLDGRINGEPVA